LYSKGEKVTAKAHGGPIEIFGVTVAKVDDKVRLQAVDTWMDPLEMFRQIAPYGIVNKEPMGRKAEKADALDDGPGHNGVNIAEEYNNGNATQSVEQAADADIPNHVSEKTGQPADAPSQNGAGCPFMARNRTSSTVTPPEGHPHMHNEFGTNDVTNGVNGVLSNGDTSGQSHVNSANNHDLTEPQETPTQATFLQAAKQLATAAVSAVSNGVASYNTTSHSSTLQPSSNEYGTFIEPAGTAPTTHDVAMDIDTTTSATVEPGNSVTATDNGDLSSAGHETGVNAQPAKPPAEEDVPRSVYSSAVTGDVEDVIKVAKNGDYVDESITTGTYEAADKHLESSADEVHPHPKTMEDEVKPDRGEAVAVSANTKETQQTYKEMSEIKPEEKDLVMNRE
jgi:hypothetical protein